MKKFLTVFFVFFLSGCVKASAVELPVLMYHSVDDTGGMYSVTAEKIERDIASLKEAGYTTVLFEDVIDYVYNGAELPEKSVVITFDDGYENNYTTLLPMAERLDFKYEVFAVAGFLHYSPYAMEWDEVKRVNESPLGAIGCHTHNMHIGYPERAGVVRKEGEDFREWEHLFRNDLYLAKMLFVENMGENPVTFAYPYGSFSFEAERVLREEGYKVTVTTEPGVNVIEKGDKEALYLMMRISMDGITASPVEVIEACRQKHTTEAIEKAKKEVYSQKFVSRADALKALYGEKLTEATGDLHYVAGYRDMKHIDAATKMLFAKCVQNNIISGFPDWTMRPSHYITRGEFALLLARRTGYDGRGVTHTFPDSSYWNDWALSWCCEKGYMIGYGESFGVNDFLTKKQLDIICERIK